MWDWLHPVLTVPYVPTLGPVHPRAIVAGLFTDVLRVAGTGQFLSHDKDRRWACRKDEHVLTQAITQESGLVLIPTLSTGRRPCVKIHVYSQDPHGALARAADLGRRLCRECDTEKGRLIWFHPPDVEPDPVAACIRIQMHSFAPGHQTPAVEAEPVRIVPLHEVCDPERATFSAFAEKLVAEGFAFLDSRIRKGGTGPVLTCRRDQKIVGAIGPMETMPDSRGETRLLPQYFGVLPQHRGLGLGRALWQAAMRWGQQHQAAYQLLQTKVGSASDRLCRSEGLTDLGLVCTSNL